MKAFDSGIERRWQRGFTLLEMLLGLVLLALLMLALFSGLRTGARSWDAVDGHLQEVAGTRAAHDFLERLVSRARPVKFAGESGPVPYFRGEEAELEFVAPMMTHLVEGGLMLVRVSGAGGSIRIGATPYGPREDLQEDLEAAKAYRLMDGVKSVGFRYYGQPESTTEEAAWHADWPLESARLPRLVEIEVVAEGVTWPPFVVRLDSA